MRITWKDVYHPVGEWRDENDDKVEIDHGFRSINS